MIFRFSRRLISTTSRPRKETPVMQESNENILIVNKHPLPFSTDNDNGSTEKKARLENDQDQQQESGGKQRLPKRKVAILMGFRGTGYYGMQL
jgi:hypothetical protein